LQIITTRETHVLLRKLPVVAGVVGGGGDGGPAVV